MAVSATTTHSNDTTPLALVQLPALPLDRYAALVTRLQAEAPDQATADRIGRGSDLLVHNSIYETATVGVYRVESCREAGTYHTTTSPRCDCVDAQRGHHCKHSHTITILHAACAEASYDRAVTRWALTAKGEALLAARA